MAAEALNGPVDVAPTADGGPRVSYVNETGDAQQCIGFTAPYSTIDELGINPNEIDMDDTLGTGQTLIDIDSRGGVSMLDADLAGNLISYETDLVNSLVVKMAGFTGLDLGLVEIIPIPGASVPAGETVTWDAPTPDTPAAVSLICRPAGGGDLVRYNGIDPQVVADQINERLGPAGSVTAGSISGGSVEVGATAVGSVADALGQEAPPAEDDGGFFGS